MGVDCAITVADADCIITHMNAASRRINGDGTDSLIGSNLMDCHNERSRQIIRRILDTGGKNVYTIQKKGQKKLIYQTAWRKPDGTVGGIVEFSMVIPEEMPHYVRS